MTARRPPGFTLLEVLVALAIGALALGALGALVSEALGNVGHAEEYIEATQRAQSRLEQVGTALPLTPGEQSGSDGGGFSWTVAISPPHIHVAPAQAGRPAAAALYEVTVTLSWGKGGSTRHVTLRSQRIGPAVDGNA